MIAKLLHCVEYFVKRDCEKSASRLLTVPSNNETKLGLRDLFHSIDCSYFQTHFFRHQELNIVNRKFFARNISLFIEHTFNPCHGIYEQKSAA